MFSSSAEMEGRRDQTGEMGLVVAGPADDSTGPAPVWRFRKLSGSLPRRPVSGFVTDFAELSPALRLKLGYPPVIAVIIGGVSGYSRVGSSRSRVVEYVVDIYTEVDALASMNSMFLLMAISRLQRPARSANWSKVASFRFGSLEDDHTRIACKRDRFEVLTACGNKPRAVGELRRGLVALNDKAPRIRHLHVLVAEVGPTGCTMFPSYASAFGVEQVGPDQIDTGPIPHGRHGGAEGIVGG